MTFSNYNVNKYHPKYSVTKYRPKYRPNITLNHFIPCDRLFLTSCSTSLTISNLRSTFLNNFYNKNTT